MAIDMRRFTGQLIRNMGNEPDDFFIRCNKCKRYASPLIDESRECGMCHNWNGCASGSGHCHLVVHVCESCAAEHDENLS